MTLWQAIADAVGAARNTTVDPAQSQPAGSAGFSQSFRLSLPDEACS